MSLDKPSLRVTSPECHIYNSPEQRVLSVGLCIVHSVGCIFDECELTLLNNSSANAKKITHPGWILTGPMEFAAQVLVHSVMDHSKA